MLSAVVLCVAGFGRGGGDREGYRGGPPREGGFGRGRPAGDDKVRHCLQHLCSIRCRHRCHNIAAWNPVSRCADLRFPCCRLVARPLATRPPSAAVALAAAAAPLPLDCAVVHGCVFALRLTAAVTACNIPYSLPLDVLKKHMALISDRGVA